MTPATSNGSIEADRARLVELLARLLATAWLEQQQTAPQEIESDQSATPRKSKRTSLANSRNKGR